MKRLLLIVALFVSTISFAQPKTDYSYQVQSGRYNTTYKRWDWSVAEEREIAIKLDGTRVIIENNANTILDTYEDLGEDNGKDDEGDRYKVHRWKAYDNKSRKCIFTMLWYDDVPLVVYSVVYNDVAFRFYIRNNKLSNF